MHGKRDEPGGGQTAGAARSSARGGGVRPLRLALVAFALAIALLVTLAGVYELARARAPEHRAALEELIRYHTGLEVRFTVLAVRWGWYGPEALFQDVELAEAHTGGLQLRARRLIISLDTWRMLRSGHLEPRRITLEDANIDLAPSSRLPGNAARPGPPQLREAGVRLLSRWRGGEIHLSGGTLRLRVPGRPDAVSIAIEEASLHRIGAAWSGEARMVLPQSLGARLRVALQLRATADLSEISAASVDVEGRELELASWAALCGLQGQSGVPRSGRGDLQFQAAFVHGRLRAASGRIAAESLEWTWAGGAEGALFLRSARGSWHLRRRGAAWHVTLDALELEPAAREPSARPAMEPPASRRFASASGSSQARRGSAVLDLLPDGSQAWGRSRHLPLGPLFSVLRWYVPQIPPESFELVGEASEASFDWNAHRAPGTRLYASAELEGVALLETADQVALTGLAGRLTATESSLGLAVHAPAVSFVRGMARPLEPLAIDGHLEGGVRASGDWQVETRDLTIHRQGLHLSAAGAVELTREGSAALTSARVSLSDTDTALLAGLLGPQELPDWEDIATALDTGRLASGELVWRGLAGSGSRWRAARWHASIAGAHTEGLAIEHASADWDPRIDGAVRLVARVSGDAAQLVDWLRSHPRPAPWAPVLEPLELAGRTTVDVELALPGSARHVGLGAATAHLAARLEGVRMRPVPGVPPLEELRGVLSFADGRLERSTVAARWLGGPASVTLAERREQNRSLLIVSARGTADALTALQAAAGNPEEGGVDGTGDWSAYLTITRGAGPAHWQLQADSSLSGIASRWPQPFDKAPGAALPLHVDWEGGHHEAQLRIALGTRLAAVAALARTGEAWRIERGAVRLGSGTPRLPIEPVVVLGGQLAQLDLPAALALMRLASRDTALPGLRGRLSVAELRVGEGHFAEVFLEPSIIAGAGALRLESAALSGSARWPAMVDSDHPALLHFARFDIDRPGDASRLLEGAAALGAAAELAVDQLQWQGRTLGSLSAALARAGQSLETSRLSLSSPQAQASGSARCERTGCILSFSFDTRNGLAALDAFGLAPELSAREAHLEGELRWPTGAASSLASLQGRLHMQLADGVMAAARGEGAERLALLSVPALLAGLRPGSAQPRTTGPLRFVQFSADYALQDGQAVTSDLHFEGDAEILVRGRVGLVSGEYDEHAWILRGEERLPVPLRRLGLGPGVAAVWLSLRDLLEPAGGERARAALHLRGTWSDPIVVPE